MMSVTDAENLTSADAQNKAAQRKLALQQAIQILGMLPVLLLLCIAFHFLSDYRFFSLQNISIVMQQASINTVLAAGMTIVILTGGIDLSVGSILAVSAMAAVIMSKIPGWGLLGIPAALLCGLLFGSINGALIAFLRLPPFIVTLGSLTAVRGVARLMGGDTTVFNPQLPFAFIGNGNLFGVPWLVIVALVVILVCWYVLRRTVLGVHIYAVGAIPMQHA
jgi:ribose transport system permease protein